MKTFEGFPAKMSYTPVPNTFINNLLPQIEDTGEMKVTLYIMEALYNKKGYPRCVSFDELAANTSLISNFKAAKVPLDELRNALKLATERKTIIVLSTEKGEIYFLNTEADRQAVEKIKSGELKITGVKTIATEMVNMEEQINVFAIYEENIGMLTPMIAEELKKALKLATERKTIIVLSTENGEIYFLNTEADRQAAEKIKSGELKITGVKTIATEMVNMEEQINVFAIYEENIGMLTPMIAEELKDAMKLYPENWIADAIKEAVKQNARKLSYITAVLERWAKEGRSDGAYKRDIKKDDPEKYTGGEFGRFVRH